MDPVIPSLRPYDSSKLINVTAYVILALISILLSNGYIVQLARRHPIKYENNSIPRTGLIQCMLAVIPVLFMGIFHITNDTSTTLELSYHTVLFATALPLLALSAKASSKIVLKPEAMAHFIILTVSALLTCFIGYLNVVLKVIYVIALLVPITTSIKRLMAIVHLSNEPRTSEPSHVSLSDLLAYAVIPFEVILENLIIVPDMKRKLYSLPMPLKMLFSPAAFLLMCLYAHTSTATLLMVCLTLLGALGVSATIYLARARYGYVVNIYGALVALLIQHFISSQVIKTTVNLANIFDIRQQAAMLFLAAPLVSLPAVYIQCSFISRGFHSQSLYSILYFSSVAMCLSNLMAMMGDMKNSDTGLILTRVMRGTSGCTTMLVLGVLVMIYMCKYRLTAHSGIVGIYSMIQNYVITSVCSLDTEW